MSKGQRNAILVTGGRGFIGAHLVRHLTTTFPSATVVSVDIAPLEKGCARRVEIELDIRERAPLRDLFARFEFSKVFDLASVTEVGLARNEYAANIEMTRAVIDTVAACNVPKYIFFSSQLVFRKEGTLPAGDQDYYPIDAYGASKVQSELLIRSALPLDRWLILRPSYIWGEGHLRFRDGFLYRLAKGHLLIPNCETLARYYGYVRTICGQATKISEIPFRELGLKMYYLADAPISLKFLCHQLLPYLPGGRFRPVPSSLIRILGRLGDAVGHAGASFPISGLQASEMTRSYPIPIEPTLSLTGTTTHYPSAAAAVVAWALSDPAFRSRITR
jgi:hypothetical protein